MIGLVRPSRGENRLRPRAGNRRGASALEFALILPVLVAFITGTVDYGWYFLQESLVANALRDAVRAGSYQSPDPAEAGTGHCSACTDRADAVAISELLTMGISVTAADLNSSIQNIADTCALVLDPAVPHTALIGLLPVPQFYHVRVVAYAQNVTGC